MGAEYIYAPCINYYRAAHHLDWLNAVTWECLQPAQNYFLISDTTANRLLKKADVIARFPNGTVLYRNHPPAPVKKIADLKIDFESSSSTGSRYSNVTSGVGYKSKHSALTDTAKVFSDGLSYIFNDSLSEVRVLAVFSARVYVPGKHFDAMIVLQLDSAGRSVFWSGVNIKDYCGKPGQWETVSFTSQMPHAVNKGQEIKAYLWNTGIGRVYADDMELKLLTYKF